MIGSLRGTLLDRTTDGRLVIDVGGVGYLVQAGPETAARLGNVDDEVFVWIHHHVREDVEVLYGFADRVEQATFVTLIAARGIGPALALAILAIHRPDQLARIVGEEDADALCLVPGIGKKTAARLLIELKNRLDVPFEAPEGVGGAVPGADRGARADVRDALAELGFTPEEIAGVVADLPDEGVDAMLKEALRRLGGGRRGA